jgi:hypothetical protein
LSTNLGESYQKRLFETAIRLDRSLYAKPYRTPSWMERRFEFLFNLIGLLFGFFAVKIAHRKTANLVTSGFALLKAGRIPPPLDAESSKLLSRAKNIADACRRKTKKRPAVLILISHPQTSNEESGLLGELIYQSIQICNVVSPKSKLKFLQAIDDFALDTLPWPVAAIYAGAIASAHLAVDRMPEERTFTQRRLFRRFAYRRTIFHFIKALKRRRTICAALGGGVVHNTRIVYTMREYAYQVYPLAQKGTYPKQEFALKLIDILTREKECAAVTGTLSESERAGIVELFRQESIPESSIGGLIENLREELKLETPYRLRLFRIILRYTCGRGIPVLLIPLKHRLDGALQLGAARMLTKMDFKAGRLAYAEDETLSEKTADAPGFIRDFIRNSLNS